MGFGDQIFRLAQGIVQQEQSRQNLELQQKKFQEDLKQSERSFRFREQEVDAQQGFLRAKEQALQLEQQQQASPEAVRAADLKNQLTEATINLKLAEADKLRTESGRPTSVTQQLSLGRAKLETNRIVQDARTDAALEDILSGTGGASPDVDTEAIQSGMNLAGVRTRGELDAARKAALRARDEATTSDLALIPQGQEQIAQLSSNAVVLQNAWNEVNKIWDVPPNGQEFMQVAREQYGDTLADAIFTQVVVDPAERRAQIWQPGELNQRAYGAIIGTGNAEAIANFIRQSPGDLLNNGFITANGANQLGQLLTEEGLPLETAKEVIRTLTPQ